MEVSGQFLTPGRLTLRTHWTGGWVGPRAGPDAMKKTKNLSPAGNRTQAVQPLARPYTDGATPEAPPAEPLLWNQTPGNLWRLW
jgi:hypothetical protein